jgi:hypothetical protein
MVVLFCVARRAPDRCESIDHATSAAPFGPMPGIRRVEAVRGRRGFFQGHTKKFVIEFLRDIGPVGQAFVATLRRDDGARQCARVTVNRSRFGVLSFSVRVQVRRRA